MTPLKRTPQQARSRARVNKILDAAEALLAEGGYEAVTTNAIAAHADISIGSLYVFFPNRDVILQALADRYRSDLRGMLADLVTPERLEHSVNDLIGSTIDAFTTLHQQHRGFRSVFTSTIASPQLTTIGAELHQEVIQHVETLIKRALPHLEADSCSLYANVCVQAAKGILPLSEQGDASWRAQVIAEVKRLLTTYLDVIANEQNV